MQECPSDVLGLFCFGCDLFIFCEYFKTPYFSEEKTDIWYDNRTNSWVAGISGWIYGVSKPTPFGFKMLNCFSYNNKLWISKDAFAFVPLP